MLIITTNAFASGLDVGTVLPWAGPKILVILPGSGLAQQQIRCLEEEFITLEFLRPPEGIVDIMATLARCLLSRMREADWPLLYLDRPFAPPEIEAHLEVVREELHDIAWEVMNDGQLAMLRAGEMVATSPLFPELLRLAGERAVGDVLFAELLRDTFAWNSE